MSIVTEVPVGEIRVRVRGALPSREDGEGSVQVRLDPVDRIGNAKVFVTCS